MPRTILHQPGEILGYRANGRPIYTIAGGSQMAPETTPVISVPVPPPATTQQQLPPNLEAGVRYYTQAELDAERERVRQQEKDKLYSDLEDLRGRVGVFETERQQREREAEEARAAAAAAAEEKRLAEMSFAEKLAETTKTWEQRHAEMQEAIQARDLLLDRERQWTDLQSYRTELLNQRGEELMPELRDLVQGNSREEVDRSFDLVLAKTQQIVASVTGQQQQAIQMAPGVSATSPAFGAPADMQEQYRNYSLQELRDMPLSEYGRMRPQLLGAAGSRPQTSNRGMYD